MPVAAAPQPPAPLGRAGPLKRILAVHLTLTVGILLGLRHTPPTETSSAYPELGPNYASFAGPGGMSVAVAVGGRRWYGPQSAFIENAPVSFLGHAVHLCEMPEGLKSALAGRIVVADLTKASCQFDVMYRNLDSTGASALFNLDTFPGAGMKTFAYNAKVPDGRMLFLDFPRRTMIVPHGTQLGRPAQDFFPASIESGDLTTGTVRLSDPLDNPFVRSFAHPLWVLWLRCFVPLLAFIAFCDALAVVLQERWRRAYILSQQQQQRSNEPALIGWTVAEIGCFVVMMATLIMGLLFLSGAYGPYFFPQSVFVTFLSGCMEAWSTFTTLVLALFMQEQSRLGFRNSARGSSFWQRNRRALWALTVACIIYPLSLIVLNVLLVLFNQTDIFRHTASKGSGNFLWGIAIWTVVQPFACIYYFNSARKYIAPIRAFHRQRSQILHRDDGLLPGQSAGGPPRVGSPEGAVASRVAAEAEAAGMSAFSPLATTTEMTNTSFGIQLGTREGGSEREGGVGAGGGGAGGVGAGGGAVVGSGSPEGERAVDARNQQQQKQQRQYWHRRRQMQSMQSPALRIVEMQQRSERVAEITASNHRAELQERQRKQLNNLMLWVSLSGVLTMLNSLSFTILAPFLLDPALCTPLAYAVFILAYNSTRLGILYAQVRVVRRSTDPKTYTTLKTLALIWWRKVTLTSPRSDAAAGDLAAAAVAAPIAMGVGVGVGADGADDVTFDDPFVGEMDTISITVVSASGASAVDSLGAGHGATGSAIGSAAARASLDSLGSGGNVGGGGVGGGGLGGGGVSGATIEEEKGPQEGGEEP